MSDHTLPRSLEEFLAPDGAPALTQRLSWRRSAVRLQVLAMVRRANPEAPGLAYVEGVLNRAAPEARHEVLRAPEIAVYLDGWLRGIPPMPDVEVPVVALVAAVCQAAERREISWPQPLPLGCLPMGRRTIRAPGVILKHPTLIVDKSSLTLLGVGEPERHIPTRQGESGDEFSRSSHPLELVDDWLPFRNPFDDGNISIALVDEKRFVLERLLDRARALISLVERGTLLEMEETARYLSPIRAIDPTSTALRSFSSRALPGVVFVGVQRGDGDFVDERLLAESCLHEHLHNRLYLLDEAISLTRPSSPPGEYFSPWKATLRGIEGMLHAVYVFSHLSWFWRQIEDMTEGHLRAYASRRVDEHSRHLGGALASLEDTDELTPAGKAVAGAAARIATDELS